MGIALQSRDITPVTITVNRTALDKRSLDSRGWHYRFHTNIASERQELFVLSSESRF